MISISCFFNHFTNTNSDLNSTSLLTDNSSPHSVMSLSDFQDIFKNKGLLEATLEFGYPDYLSSHVAIRYDVNNDFPDSSHYQTE